nr:MAG TPA: hypothetical protein [Caudoviricetes sp.]
MNIAPFLIGFMPLFYPILHRYCKNLKSCTNPNTLRAWEIYRIV